MQITFNPTTIVTNPEQSKTLSSINIMQMIDSPERKEVRVMTQELGSLILWSGDDYDAIGQWTDQDVIDRIKQLKNIS